ncbi:amidase [Marinobacterium lutimaris]|uniref:Asp-tRNAAsn/Glu-tRNAGln amidotransferase A subunit n=1 Tax=Marinobacterium lutimaris TaxID=568106 RepID=A0A1H6D8X6_9GAMM|nr:amidase [Marinobacterium lutimaris]SEG81564.1 Asp-tRNAAsn/Glu-tRNAGln amidotransferase A subunit [Marinobacterium lutimaris]
MTTPKPNPDAKALNELGLRQALLAIDNGECTAVDVINACFDRIEAREPQVGAWQYSLSREAFLDQYLSNEAFYRQSPLKGLPVGIKDIIDTADMPTEMGSPIHKGRMPVDDASCVALIRAAGGIVLGKTVTTEFAYFKPGKTRNPADLERTPGGSSSGSAAAVADAMVPLALGSQTAASVIRPAAYCGSVGYVGSRGEFSLRGGQPLAQSLDSLGLLSRSVEDIELMRAILLRQNDPLAQADAVKPRKVLICQGDKVGETDPAMVEAINQAAALLEGQGVELVQFEDEEFLPQMVQHHIQIMGYEVARNLAVESRQPELLSEPLQDLISSGLVMERAAYLESLNAAAVGGEALWQRYADVDAILAPAAPGVAPLGHEKTGAPHMSRPWQAMGLPVISLPGLVDEAGLPLGVQLVGRAHDDDSLLALARWFEGALASA